MTCGVAFACLKDELDSTQAYLVDDDNLQLELSQFSCIPRYIVSCTPGLFSSLFVGYMEGQDPPGMLRWMHIHGIAVETLTFVAGSPWTEAALTALLSCCFMSNVPARLKSAQLTQMTDVSMNLLGWFQRVTALHLNSEPGLSARDLQPLQRLPHLTSLALEGGKHHSLDALEHLTRLFATDCQVGCVEDCACVTFLVNLVVQRSDSTQVASPLVSICSGWYVLTVS